MSNDPNKAAQPQIRPFGKLKDGGKPPNTMTTTLYIYKSLHSRIESQAALMQMHRQELLGRLLELVFPESMAPHSSLRDLINPDLVAGASSHPSTG